MAHWPSASLHLQVGVMNGKAMCCTKQAVLHVIVLLSCLSDGFDSTAAQVSRLLHSVHTPHTHPMPKSPTMCQKYG